MANRKSCLLGLAYYSASHNYKKVNFLFNLRDAEEENV